MGGGNTELQGPDLEKGVSSASLIDGKPLLGHAFGEGVVLVSTGGALHAVGASCTHYGGPLAEGLVVGHTIRCPWHHACFDLRTGQAAGAPALRDLPCFEVTQQDDLVQVRKKRTAPTSTLKREPSSVVLVGGGAASAACAETLRREGYAGPITMIGDEAPGPVDRPNLSKDYLAGTAPEEWIPLGGAERWAELRVELSVGDPVATLDTSAKTVTTRGGRSVPYGALLLATGAEPRRLDVPGAELPHVHVLRTLADTRKIIDGLAHAKRAVVVGASFIGLEVAASLVARGLEVHVVGPEPVPLARVLGPEIGAFLRSVHEAKGVRFHLGTTPAAITADHVQLAGGERLPADLVVVGVGVVPRTALAEAAGLAVDRGIVVDASLRTAADGVFAAGDVARFPEARASEAVRIEHWVHAERQGQAAARAMLGSNLPFRDVPFFWSIHHDVTLGYVGHAPSWDQASVHGSLEARDATVVYERAGKILAVATIGRDAVSLAVEAAMERGDEAEVRRLVAG